MYFSRMILNPRRRKTKAFLANPEMLHAAVESTYHTPVGTERRTLWRVDKVSDELHLYVASPEVPSFELIQEQAGWSQQVTWQCRDYSILLDRLMAGQRYSFRLTANPTRTVTDANGKKRRKAEVGVNNQRRWLLQRQEQLGAIFPEVDGEAAVNVVESRNLVFPKKGRKVTVVAVTYQGVLEVTDPEQLRKTLTTGIGKARAYGCGLLTLAPITGAQ
ncbi:type I-E CRISPR-associated protein Cas6/Cse3/CasE [Corynebacterium breve]|uniref:Type I-E CRISPR-associated protein Cas6/Cse3/CasE n=1 Tax=Corynebacterium breve TaxID=3049799 RepID=A0ABY8VF33_9CORY|nr:type I-E CRISPR-associated protein Cas6/Cse3/CasE [Corynebacterium breve]WIM67717.1 type I-E CRISPR-associated protein Cas6/Cse3/CasE [Corynebacterium breve]